MASRGEWETNKLRTNVEQQLNRLIVQLKDLEEFREELEDEYEELREDTLQQLKEFQASLSKMMQGNMTLVDEFGGVQLAIQAAVSQAFKTPEVIKLFAKKDNNSLKQRLSTLQTNVKLGKISQDAYNQQAVEILTALKKLGDSLSGEQEAFLSQHRTKAMSEFESVATELGQAAKNKILSSAATENTVYVK